VKINRLYGVPRRGAEEANPTSNHEVVGSIPGLDQWIKDHSIVVSCSVGSRHTSDLLLLWLWCGPATVALLQPLAWKPPYVESSALKRPKKKKERERKKKSSWSSCCGTAALKRKKKKKTTYKD